MSEANEVDGVVMRDYILGLTAPLSIDDLKSLIGKELVVRKTQLEWKKEVVKVDKMVITNIQITCDVESGLSTGLSAIHIFSDYYLNGVVRYNAWTDLIGIKKDILTIAA